MSKGRPGRAKRWSSVAVTVMVVGALAVTQLPGGASNRRSGGRIQWDGSIKGHTSPTMTPRVHKPQASASPARPTKAQRVAVRAHQRRVNQAWAGRTLPKGQTPVVGPKPGTETDPVVPPQIPSTFTIFRNSTLVPPAGLSSSVNEPAVSQSGKNVFYTHNWYAARSSDGGQSWTYISPFADFADFCCDQDTIYNAGRDRYFWYRQGVVPSGGTQNVFKLGVSSDGGTTFCTYTVSPTNVDGSWTNTWWDYPRIYTTNNYLYITTNLFNTGSNTFNRMVLLRYELRELTNCAGIVATVFSTTTGWSWSGVDGAETNFYMADHVDTDTMRVYRLSQGSGSLFFVDRNIPAWTFTNRDGTCTILGGSNPCLRADQRITGGAVRKYIDHTELTWFWNVKEGGGFTYPYVNNATFYEPVMNYKDRQLIQSNSAAYQYASVAPDRRGSLGIQTAFFLPNDYPFMVVGLDDDYNGKPPGWELYAVNSSTAGPDANVWGDYNRVRAFEPTQLGWVASGHTEQAGGQNARPHYVVFGREREQNNITRWWDK